MTYDFSGTLAAMEALSPDARREREWKDAQRQQKRLLFEQQIENAKQEGEINARKMKKMDRYDQLKGMVNDIEAFREKVLTEGVMTESDKMRMAYEWTEKYTDPQMQKLFMQGLEGNYAAIYDTLDAADQDLVREGFLEKKDIEERRLRLTKDGKVARIGKNSRLYAGELEESEIDAVEILGRDAYGTPEFNDLVKRLATTDLEGKEAQTEDAKAKAELNAANAKRINSDLKRKAGITKEYLTPAQRKVDENYANEYVEWIKGGMADVEKNLSQLLDVNRALTSGENLTGGYIGLTPDKLLAYMNPEALNNKEMVQEVVQRNLRLILGHQFTEKEGERLINRAYNDALDEEVNRQRVGRLILQINSAAHAMDETAKHYEEHGTLKDYEGRRLTKADLDRTWDATAGRPPEIGQEKTHKGRRYVYVGGNPGDKSSWVPL